MDQPDRVNYLAKRYLSNTCTREEMDELLDYITRHPDDEYLLATLQDSRHVETSMGGSGQSGWPAIAEMNLLKLKCIPP